MTRRRHDRTSGGAANPQLPVVPEPLHPREPDADADADAGAGALAAQLVVLAKQPLPGRVKTRLSPPLTTAQAAQVARAALLDTLDVVATVPVLRRTLVLAGSPTGWVPAGFQVLPQRSGDLGARLAGAFSDVHAACPAPMLLIGMDTPQVTRELLTDALRSLLAPRTGAVLGTAHDGGWWALGLHAPVSGLFDDVPMSTDQAGTVQRQRLRAAGLTSCALPVLLDLDHVEDIAVIAAQQRPVARLPRLSARLPLPTRQPVPALGDTLDQAQRAVRRDEQAASRTSPQDPLVVGRRWS